MSTKNSLMASADMLLASKSFRDSLLPSVRGAREQVSMGRFIEDHYEKTIQDLSGLAFSPLAGFTIILDTPVAESTAETGFPDEIFTVTYVEYTTGFRLRLRAKVVLQEGYFPVGVSWKAFEDAVTIRAELLLNECGYSIVDAPASGLRKAKFEFGNDLLEGLFTVDRTIFKYLNDDGRERQGNAEFIDTPENLVFRVPATALKSNNAGFYADLCSEAPFYVHRSRLGLLNSFVGKRIWFNTNSSHDSRGDALKITEREVKKLTAPPIKKHECYHCDRTYGYILEIDALEESPEDTPAQLEVKDGYLYLTQSKQWMSPPEYKRQFKFDKPSEWVRVQLRSVGREVDHYFAGIEQNAFPMRYLDTVSELFKKDMCATPTVKKVNEPAVDVEVLTAPPSTPAPVPPAPPTQQAQTFTGRFAAAWKAFWS